MKTLVIMDPIEGIKPYKDTSFCHDAGRTSAWA